MSSIYRKGRDGYFYYQTYVYNKDTGKKDKRIFHSLRTKNEYSLKDRLKLLNFDFYSIILPSFNFYIQIF